MASLPPRLSESIIKSYIPDPYFARGKSYYRNGHISDTMQRGNMIEGDCEGSEYDPYRVEVRLGSRGIEGNECSCPMGGDCKHVVALLLAWYHEPESFEDQTPRAAGRKGEKLSKAKVDLTDPEAVRQQIRRVMRYAGDWHSSYRVADALSKILDRAEALAKGGEWTKAEAIYRAVVDETIEGYGEFYDEGEVAEEVSRAIEGLGQGVAFAPNATARRELLRFIFEAVDSDNEHGLGIGETAKKVLLESATSADYDHISKWIETMLKRGWGYNEDWGNLLKSLARLAGNLDGFIQRARTYRLYHPLFEVLIELGRLDEAVEVAETLAMTAPLERIMLAQKIEAANRIDEALALAEAGMTAHDNEQLYDWLTKRYKKYGRTDKLINLHLKRWQEWPNEKKYSDIAAAVGDSEQWPGLRSSLLTGLELRSEFGLLAKLAAREMEWELAWTAARRNTNYDAVAVRLDVAKAMTKDAPEQALDAYLELADSLAKKSNAENYRLAASCLRRARDLFIALDEKEEWTQFITAFRNMHKKKTGLMDALRQARV